MMDYYFKTAKNSTVIQKAYGEFLTQMLVLSGLNIANADNQATTVYNIERPLASSHITNIELGDVQVSYSKLTVTDLEKEQSNIRWTAFLEI